MLDPAPLGTLTTISPPRASFYGLAICFLMGLCNLIAKPATDQDTVQSLEEWNAKTLEEVFKTYTTKPILDEKYPASEAAGEFRTPVRAAYPINDPNSKTVIIMEYWWKDGDYIVSFFFHRKNGIGKSWKPSAGKKTSCTERSAESAP